MRPTEIRLVLEDRYIDNGNSYMVTVTLVDGSIFYGEFIRAMQFRFNVGFNKWLICSAGKDILLDGEDIVSIGMSMAPGDLNR